MPVLKMGHGCTFVTVAFSVEVVGGERLPLNVYSLKGNEMWRTLCWCGSLVVGLAILSGCAGKMKEDLPEVFPVTGVVKMNGQPLAGASVMFNGTSKGKARTGAGSTNAKGEFKIVTFQHREGAVPGEHIVTVSKINTPTEADPKTGELPPAVELLPIRFNDLGVTPLRATVSDKGKNHFEFTLD